VREKRRENELGVTSCAGLQHEKQCARADVAPNRSTTEMVCGPPSSFSRSRVHRLLSPSRRNFPRARSLPWRFPLRAKSSPPGAKSYPPEAESSSSKVDLSSPHSLLHDFPSVITLALDKSDDSPVEERVGAAVSPLSDLLSVWRHVAHGATRFLRA